MEHRYALRFENGERRGEIVTLTGGGTTFGRRPGNGVQILDASVSGKHAEIVVDEQGCLLRDLGSTNGTRIGSERVSERRLAHGDPVLLGNVRLTFIDATIDAHPPTSGSEALEVPPGASSAQAAGEGVRTISADKVAQSGRRSLVAAALVLVLLGGGATAWFLLRSSGGESVAAHKPVESVPGNLLGASSAFESDAGAAAEAGGVAWEPAESASASFRIERSARASGSSGLRADLEPGQWAEHRSAPVNLSSARALRVRGWLRAEGGASARVGVVLESSANRGGPCEAWSAPVAAGAEFAAHEFVLQVPPVYDRARALVRASAGAQAGVAMADDVSLVALNAQDAGSAGVLAFENHQLFLFGDPPQSALLFMIDHPVLRDVGFAAPSSGGAPVQMPGLGLKAEARPNGFGLKPSAEGAAQVLTLFVEPAQVALGLATTGEGGYRTHQAAFERAAASSLLAGTGRDLVRVAFDTPVTLRGRPESEGFRIEAELPAGAGASLQLAFKDERAQAETLAIGAVPPARRARVELVKIRRGKARVRNARTPRQPNAGHSFAGGDWASQEFRTEVTGQEIGKPQGHLLAVFLVLTKGVGDEHQIAPAGGHFLGVAWIDGAGARSVRGECNQNQTQPTAGLALSIHEGRKLRFGVAACNMQNKAIEFRPMSTPFPKQQTITDVRHGSYIALSKTPLNEWPAVGHISIAAKGPLWVTDLAARLNSALVRLNQGLFDANTNHAENKSKVAAIQQIKTALLNLDDDLVGLFWPPVRPPFPGAGLKKTAESVPFVLKNPGKGNAGWVTFRCDVEKNATTKEVSSWGFCTSCSIVFYPALRKKTPGGNAFPAFLLEGEGESDSSSVNLDISSNLRERRPESSSL